MNLLVLNPSFQPIGVIDTFESIIWTDRYDDVGDFELTGLADSETMSLLRQENYIVYEDSVHLMIIEKIELTADPENGIKYKVSGRSVESILDRRIVWQQTILSSKVQYAINRLLNENVISPENTDRTIGFITFNQSSDQRLEDLHIDAQFTGDNLLTAITEICQKNNLGYRLYLNQAANGFVFEIYLGLDRSYDQIENSRVIFSPSFDNLVGSNYILNSEPLRTVAVVAGEGEGLSRTRSIVGDISGQGLARREMYVDARDLSSDTDPPITMEEYTEQLDERGLEKLAEQGIIENFDGSIDTTLSFKYGTDFDLGDIVQVENELGMKLKCRVAEITFSEDASGFSIYPTFRSLEDEQAGE